MKRKARNLIFSVSVFTLASLGLAHIFDRTCGTSCIGQAFASQGDGDLLGRLIEAKLENWVDGDTNISYSLGDNAETIQLKDIGGDDKNPDRSQAAKSLSFPAQNLRNIEISSYVTDWKIRVGNDTQGSFVFTGYLQPEEWTLSQTDSKLLLKTMKKGPTRGELILPKDFAGELLLRSISGSVLVESLGSIPHLTLNTISGDLSLRAAPMQSLTIQTVSGDIDFVPASSKKELELTVESVSGDLDFTMTNPLKKIALNSVSGDVTIQKNSEIGFDLSLQGISSDFDGLPAEVKISKGFGPQSAEGAFGPEPRVPLSFESVSGDFEIRP